MIEPAVTQIGVSIHAPAGGATCVHTGFTASGKFQSTLPRGERLGTVSVSVCAAAFQSTLPRGERRNRHLRQH